MILFFAITSLVFGFLWFRSRELNIELAQQIESEKAQQIVLQSRFKEQQSEDNHAQKVISSIKFALDQSEKIVEETSQELVIFEEKVRSNTETTEKIVSSMGVLGESF